MFRRFHIFREGRLEAKLDQLAEIIANQTSPLNDKLASLHEGMAHQTSLLNDKLGDLHEGMAHQTSLLNDKLNNLHEGIAHQTSLLNDKLDDLRHAIASQTNALNEKSAGRAMPEGETSDPVQWRRSLVDDLKRFHAEALKQLTTLNMRLRDLQEKASIASAHKVSLPEESELGHRIHLSSEFQSAANSDMSQIPFPAIRLDEKSGLMTMVERSEFRKCVQFFVSQMAGAQPPAFALEQAFLFSLIRNLRPEHVFEIGCYRGAVTEIMCCALQANGTGVLHVPGEDVPENARSMFDHWPNELRSFIRVHAVDEIGFLKQMKAEGITSELVVLNRLHNYELSFALESASIAVKPGGLVVIIDIDHADADIAIRNFLSHRPEWDPQPVKQVYLTDQTNASPAILAMGWAILLAPSGDRSGRAHASSGPRSLAGGDASAQLAGSPLLRSATLDQSNSSGS
jgi:hypothetical protein